MMTTRATGVLAMLCMASACALATQAQAEDLAIRIGYPSGMNGEVPVVMQKASLAQKHGLNPEFTAFQYGPPMMEGLVSGQLDAVVTSFLPPLSLSAKAPGSIKFVATLGQSSYSLLVPKDSTAKTLADLKGTKVGVSFNSETHLDLLLALEKLNLDPKSDIQLVNLSPRELPAALQKGLVDAAVIRQPQTLRLEETIGARKIRTWPFRFTSIVSSKFIERHPGALTQYVAALKDAIFYIATNPDQSATWFAEALRVDPEVVKKLANENPLFLVRSRDEIKIEPGEAFKVELAARQKAALKYGLVKSEIDTATLTLTK